MKTQNTIFGKYTLALVALSGSIAFTGSARANHKYELLRAKADAVFHAMIDLDRPLIDSYARSRVFGEMMAMSGMIKGKAAWLRSMSYRNSPCQWSSELDKLDEWVHQMEALIETAHFRAARGLDPPISCSSAEAIGRLAEITEMVHCMRDALSVAVVQPPSRVVFPPEPVVCNPGYGNSRYGGKYDYRGHGHNTAPVNRNSGYRSDRSNHGYDGVNINGARGGNVRIDGGGMTIGKGGLSFSFKF